MGQDPIDPFIRCWRRDHHGPIADGPIADGSHCGGDVRRGTNAPRSLFQRDQRTAQSADRRRARRGLGYDTVPTAHWKIVDGTIKKIASGKVPRVPDGRPLNGGDLMTVETFGDFELSWEWKVTPGANSGVKYNVSEALSVAQGGQVTPAAVAQGSIAPHHSALGFEYEKLDDDHHPDGQLPTHRAGALYDLVAPNGAKQLRPVGEWNQSRVIFRGNHG